MSSSPRSLFRLIKTAVAVSLVGATCAVVPAIASAAPPASLSGAYAGWGDASNLSAFGTWRGAPATVAADYLNFDDWSSIADPGTLLSDWSAFHAAGGQLVLSVPLLVSDSPGTFAAGAAGAYDKSFLSMGHQLVSDGYGSIVLRLGWEFNGNWFPWSVQPNSLTMGAGAFVAYWRHVVDLLRSIPGAHFKFDWTVTLGAGDISPTAAYPGSAYVDYVGMDVYDRGWSATGGPIADPAQRWQQITGQTDGMNYWASFAAKNDKPVTLPEWGVWNDESENGGGDDPYFIQQMYSWIKSHNVGYEMYFDTDNSVMNSTTEPQSAAQYRALWGDAGTSASTSSTPSTTGTPSSGDVTTTSTTSPAGASGSQTPAKPTTTKQTTTKFSRRPVKRSRATVQKAARKAHVSRAKSLRRAKRVVRKRTTKKAASKRVAGRKAVASTRRPALKAPALR